MRVLASLSGGVDSAVAAASAVDANRLFTALPSALEGAGRTCRVTHEAAGGNRKPE